MESRPRSSLSMNAWDWLTQQIAERWGREKRLSSAVGGTSASQQAKYAFDYAVSLPGRICILLVRLYQKLLSPLLGQNCRFHPSCSQYFIQAVQKYGLLRGGWKGIRRICRCHPWHPGGFDPP